MDATVVRILSGLWAPSRMMRGLRETISMRRGSLTLARPRAIVESGILRYRAIAVQIEALESW